MAGKGTGPKTVATLDDLRNLTDRTKTVEIEGLAIVIRQVSVKEFIEMQEEAEGADGEVDEWAGTVALLSAAIVDPPLGEDVDLLGKLPVGVVRQLTSAIAEFAGTDATFTGGSPIE